MSQSRLINAQAIQDWLRQRLASLLNAEVEQIVVNVPFDSYGLESSDVVGISAELEDWLGYELGDPTLMYEYNTVESLSEFVAMTVKNDKVSLQN